MVVRSRPSFSRQIKRSPTWNTAIQNWLRSYTLDAISQHDSNYLGPVIVTLLTYCVYLVLLSPFIFLIKSVKVDAGLVVPPVVILLNALLCIFIYPRFFDVSAYPNTFYFSIGVYQSAYIWVVLVLNSLLSSAFAEFQVDNAFSILSTVTYTYVAGYFLHRNFRDRLEGRSEKQRFVFAICVMIDSFLAVVIVLISSTQYRLFNL